MYRSCGTFSYRERLQQQNGDIRKRDGMKTICCEVGGRASGETFPPPQAQQFRNNSGSTAVFSYVQNWPRNERTDHTNPIETERIKWFSLFFYR